MIKDHHGLTVTGASAQSADDYRQALYAFHCYAGDPVGPVEAAIARDPGFLMGQVLKAWLHLVGSNAEAVAVGRAACEAASGLPGTERELAHAAALRLYLSGDLRACARVLEDVSIAHPRDALALQCGQLVDFLVGDSRMLRDRISRALPLWSPDMPDHHAVLGMLAFGLEETGLYARAEAAGRQAVELEPRNGWAQHAVAHVLEMQDRRNEGVAWMRTDIHAWTHESFFAVHNWWHLALFHLGLGEVEEALSLFDGPIWGHRSDLAFDLVDAAALLWRLHLQGVDVANRWSALADVYEAKPDKGAYAFDDAHAMMAFVGAGRADAASALIEIQNDALKGPGDNPGFVRDVGLPLMTGLRAFGEGDYASALEWLRPVRNHASRFGGSHAQRDLIDLTLIEAARRGRRPELERALLAERAAAKPLPHGRLGQFRTAA